LALKEGPDCLKPCKQSTLPLIHLELPRSYYNSWTPEVPVLSAINVATWFFTEDFVVISAINAATWFFVKEFVVLSVCFLKCQNGKAVTMLVARCLHHKV
jgi:hypothetical protein